MRTLIAILLAAFVAAGATYALIRKNAGSNLAAAMAERESAWQKEKEALEKSLAEQRSRPGSIRVSSTSAPAVTATQSLSAEAIIEQLKGIKANSRDKSIRKVVYHLESLAALGPQALPAIKAFMEEFKDVDYFGVRQEEEQRREVAAAEVNAARPEASPAQADRENRRGPGDRNNRGGDDRNRERMRAMIGGGGFGGGGRNDVRLNFSMPPSLRLGMVDVLAQIGGPEAEEILSNMLSETGRAVEVAYVAKTLQEITPNKYRDVAVTSAKDLLMNPMQAAEGDRLDENAKDYLYYVLTMYNDASFAPAAQGMIVGNDGKLDMRALSYLNSTLKEQAMPSVYAAYNDPRITNQFDKAPLMQMALNYVGPNQQANEMLSSVISNEQLPGELRAMALMGLTRGEPSKETLQARLQVVEALKTSTADERVQRSLQFTEGNIQKLLAGQPIEENPWRTMFQGGGRPGGNEPGRPTNDGGMRRNRGQGGNREGGQNR
jgi:hypothetical protein